MRPTNPKWILLAVVLLAMPLGARERTGELAPAEVKKEQDAIMKALETGNKHHMNNLSRKPGLARVIVVSCADSRVPPEVVFHMPPGELFTARAFGNIVDKELLATLEYGAEHLGCKVLVVMGHTNCSALKEAIEEHNHPRTEWRSLNQKALYQELEPAVAEVEEDQRIAQARTGKVLVGEAFLDAVVRTNILSTMHAIREQSPLIWNLEQGDMIKMVGCIYHLDSGKVEWIKQ
jgi:carbonic anhydrase